MDLSLKDTKYVKIGYSNNSSRIGGNVYQIAFIGSASLENNI